MTVDIRKLIDNATSSGAENKWPGGKGMVQCVSSDFNGATVKLQARLSGIDTFVDVGTDASFTANGWGAFDLPPCYIKGVITGATPAGGVKFYVAPTPLDDSRRLNPKGE